MAKKFLLLVPIITFMSCGEKTPGAENHLKSPETTNKTVPGEIPLKGVWGMTDYFDTISDRRELARYRMLPATWFGVLLQIDQDSIKFFGSIHELKTGYHKESDTLTSLVAPIGEKAQYLLIRRGEELHLVFLNPSSGTVKKNYIFRKRDDLQWMTENLDPVHEIGSHVTRYFNETLLAGKYTINNSRTQITFLPAGEIKNWDRYDSYHIRNYFGTLHPFQNKDVLMLKKGENTEYWNWLFTTKNQITLTRMEVDWKVSDDYYLTKEKIILTRQ